MNDTFFTVKQFAKELKMNEQTVRKLIREKKIHAIAFNEGGRYRIPFAEYLKFITLPSEDDK